MTELDENSPPPKLIIDEAEDGEPAEEYPVTPPKFTHSSDTEIGRLQRENVILEQELDQASTINIDLLMVDLQQGSKHIIYSETELEKIATAEEALKIQEMQRTQGIEIAFQYMFTKFMDGGTHARNATAGIERIRHTMDSIQQKMEYGTFVQTPEGEDRLGVK